MTAPLPSWTPELATLDLLLSVADLGSVGKAAAAHGISQPSASARLARLERRLGVPVLRRSTRGSTLTPAGEAVVTWARGVVDAARTLTDGVLTLRADRNARLRVAASLTVAEYLLPQWLLALRRHNPGLDVAASVANSRDVCAAVRDGRADVGFVEAPDVPIGLSARQVGTDRLAIVVAADYPLARRRGRLHTRDLPGLPLLLREPGSGTRDTFLDALAAALGERPPLPHATELGSTATILATARAGGGVAVLSARAASADVASGALTELEVPGLLMRRPLHAVWLGRRPSDLAAQLIELASN
ncbi:MAG TPA: LysR family transcriptional regulator [Jatrophihabitantaceae bacterium]|nr:LysR family transcriptional regulator [Jatrophihabitantaceae bacterium]